MVELAPYILKRMTRNVYLHYRASYKIREFDKNPWKALMCRLVKLRGRGRQRGHVFACQHLHGSVRTFGVLMLLVEADSPLSRNLFAGQYTTPQQPASNGIPSGPTFQLFAPADWRNPIARFTTQLAITTRTYRPSDTLLNYPFDRYVSPVFVACFLHPDLSAAT